MSHRTKPPQSGAQRTGQAENWGRPSGGTDFPLARPGGGFSVTSRRPCVVAVTGRMETALQPAHKAEESTLRRGEGNGGSNWNKGKGRWGCGWQGWMEE